MALKNDTRINLKVDEENSEQLRQLSETITSNGGLTHTLVSLGNDALAIGIRTLALKYEPNARPKNPPFKSGLKK